MSVEQPPVDSPVPEESPHAEVIRRLEATPDPRTLIRTFRLVGNEGLALELTELDSAERGRIGRLAARLLEQSIDARGRLSCGTPQAHLEFWKLFCLLGRCDSRSAAEWQRPAARLLEQTLQSFESSGRRSLEDSRRALDWLYQLLALQNTPAGAGQVQGSLARFDAALRAVTARSAIEHCDQWIKSSMDFRSEINARHDTLARVTEFLQDDAHFGQPPPGLAEARRVWSRLMSNPDLRRTPDRRSSFVVRGPNVAATEWRLEYFPSDSVTGGLFTARCRDRDSLISMDLRELTARLARDGDRFLAVLAEEAITNRSREESGRKALGAFDLPPTGPICHVRVFPRRYDSVMSANLQAALLLSGTLVRRYGTRMQVPHLIMDDNPREQVRRTIRGGYTAGARSFCVDIFSHGDRNRGLISFRPPLTARDLVAIADEFADCRFNFSSMACHGGGLQEGFMDELRRDDLRVAIEDDAGRTPLRDRANLFVQSRPNTVNHTALRREGSRGYETYSSVYYLALIRELESGRTFGDAVRRATDASRQATPFHAETILNGNLVQLGTSDSSAHA